MTGAAGPAPGDAPDAADVPAEPVAAGPDALARLRAELADPPFHALLQPVALGVEADGSVSVGLDYRDELAGRRGARFFHGGVIASLADLAAHAVVALRQDGMAPTIDLRIDYLRPAESPRLVARARLLRLGRSVSRADVEIRTAEGRLVAVARGAFGSTPSSTDGGPARSTGHRP